MMSVSVYWCVSWVPEIICGGHTSDAAIIHDRRTAAAGEERKGGGIAKTIRGVPRGKKLSHMYLKIEK